MFVRRTIGIALAAAIGLIPLAPAEHVHDSEQGHHERVVHRHAEGHHLAEHADTHEGVFDADDLPVVTLDAVYTVPVASVPSGAPGQAVVVLIDPLRAERAYGAAGEVERQIHGPPRSSASLRAPPASLAL